MGKRSFRFGDDLDEADVFHNRTVDLDGFIDDMESQNVRRTPLLRGKRSGRQLVDDRNEARRLRDLLQDWEDWD